MTSGAEEEGGVSKWRRLPPVPPAAGLSRLGFSSDSIPGSLSLSGCPGCLVGDYRIRNTLWFQLWA